MYPYTIGEAESVAKTQLNQIPDIYHRELFQWLCKRVRELERECAGLRAERAAVVKWGREKTADALKIRHLRFLVHLVAEEPCMRQTTEFRGECGRDGQPQEGWCAVCRCKAEMERHTL